MVTASRLMPWTLSVVLAAVLKTMSVGTLSICQSLAMVMPRITVTNPVSANTPLGVISVNGELSLAVVDKWHICRVRLGMLDRLTARRWRITGGNVGAVALETLTGNAARATCRCNWQIVSALFTGATIDTPCSITGGAA